MNDIVVGILIPTMNRSKLLSNQLEFYKHHNSIHPIYIGDSSFPEEALKLREIIEHYRSSLKIHYFYYPNQNDSIVLYKLAQEAEEEFVTYCGDDDFQIPESLSRCAHFLSANPEYASASGGSLIFSFENEFNVNPYCNTPSLDDNDSLARLNFFFRNYYSAIFSIQRRQNVIEILSKIHNIKDRLMTEVYFGSILTLQGKAKRLPFLGLFRQDHPFRGDYPKGTNWQQGIEWQNSYTQTVNDLTEKAASQMNLNRTVIELNIKESFQYYLSRGFDAKNSRNFLVMKMQLRLLELIRSNFFLKQSVKKIILSFRFIINPYDFNNNVLNPKSPYYKDFKFIENIFKK